MTIAACQYRLKLTVTDNQLMRCDVIISVDFHFDEYDFQFLILFDYEL